jgi:hypothetical protein
MTERTKASKMQGMAPKDSPLMVAWDRYRATEAYQNTRHWATSEEYVDGSLWAAFSEGWREQAEPGRFNVGGIWLRNLGDRLIVAVEVEGVWIDLIEEYGKLGECSISHFVSPAGIREAISRQARTP